MSRLADGDPAAFEPVFDALWPVLLRYCTRALASAADGEDAAQRSLLKLLERAPDYDRERPALGWALGFAFWECRTERTRRRRAGTEPDVPSRTDLTAEELVAEKEEQEALMAALADLSEAERALLLKEVTPLLGGTHPATLRKRRQRLLDRVRSACLSVLNPSRGKS
jgi:RNA polymerase sigma-70 factor (ECF subfamily)